MAKQSKAPEAPATEPKPKAVGHSAQERMFNQKLEKTGVKLEAFIFRPAVQWMEEQYGFRLTWPDGATRTGIIPWDLSTFSHLLKMANEGPIA